MTDPLIQYIRPKISNGGIREQAHIRKWWTESLGSQGLLAWEYPLAGYHIDALWFPDNPMNQETLKGAGARKAYPVDGKKVILCEAKDKLSPELIGQAIVYKRLLVKTNAIVDRVVLFAEKANPHMLELAKEYDFEVLIESALAT